MDNKEISPHTVLVNHGGAEDKNFANIINEDQDEDEVNVIRHSPYYVPSNLPSELMNKDNAFSVLSLNAQSLFAKFSSLQATLELFASQHIRFPIICIQETWITDESQLPLVSLEGYDCFFVKPTASSHGGLITYVDNDFEVSVIKKIDGSTIWEGLFIEVKHRLVNNKIIIGNIYKPPRDNNNPANIKAFITELEPIIQELSSSNTEVLVCGDYNINLLKMTGEAHFSDFFEMMLGHSFYPKITLPTRLNTSSRATLIDYIYCKLSSCSISTCAGIILDQLSDHFPYFLSLDNMSIKNIKPPKRVKQTINNHEAMENMLDYMKSNDIYDKLKTNLLEDPNINYDILHEYMKNTKEIFFPNKYVKFHKHRHKKNKWITSGILRSIKFRDKMYVKFKQCPRHTAEYPILQNNLRVFNSILKGIIREAKIKYYNNLFNQYRGDIQMTWKTISEIICKSNYKRKELEKIIIDSKVISDKGDICTRFNEFFTNIGPKLADKIDSGKKKSFDAYLKKRVLTSFTFSLVDHNVTSKCVSSLASKSSSGHDGISLKLLKFLSSALVKPLTLIINQFLLTGIFPTKLKIARVLHSFKKDDVTLMDNYRPISLLTSTSKLFEKIVFTQLYNYFHENQLFYPSQYGFRKMHSTELAALELTDRILKDIDERNVSLAIFMDLSKAFDTLDHQILLTKLNFYGIGGLALNWFSSYLTGRKQYVEVDGVKSGLLPLSTGVPQGSILGPLLFLIYMNDIPNANEDFKHILYADDTTLFSTIQVLATTPFDVNNQLTQIYDWLAVNKLSLNIKKTKYIVFHAINKDIDGLIPELKINDIIIERVENFNFLGLIFNEHMFWKHHINTIANKLIKLSGILNKLKRFLPGYILRTLYFSMVQSRLLYGILAWGFDHQRLVKIQKRFIRIISLSTYNAHTEPWFKHFEILKINNLFDLNCLKFIDNYNKRELPNYFLNFRYEQRSSIHDHDTRFADLIDAEPTRTVMAENCIRHHIVTLLNCTPSCILDKIATHSLQGFTFYIKRYYLNQMSYECSLRQCYVCNMQSRWWPWPDNDFTETR